MTQKYSQLVASQVRAECARRQISHGELAEALGISHASVSRRLSGRIPFELDELQAIATILDIDVTDLVSAA